MAVNAITKPEAGGEKGIQDKGLQDKINALIESGKVDKSTIARGVNKSPATISLYLQSNYGGRIDIIEHDLKAWLKTFEKSEQEEFKKLEFVETTVVKRIFNAANMCQMRGKMGVCYGSPGIGKTTTILEYKKSSSGVIIVDPCEHTSARAVLIQLATQLKIPYNNYMSQDEFIQNVSRKLNKNKGLIIVDEAENLKIDSFKVLRKLYDRAEGSCGLLFVGTEELSILLMKVKSGFPYISSRIGYVERLDALSFKDVEALVFQYFPKCPEALVKYISKVTGSNARAVQNLLDLCLDITKSNRIGLDSDVIDAARGKLLL